MTVRDGITRVAARVEIPRVGEQTIWFEAEDEAGSFLTTRGDAFAAALLPVASALSQPLEVRGAVSPRLAWGLRELLQLHRVWWPNGSGSVELVFPRLEAPAAAPRAVGCSFSGGVDSLFTAFRHLPRNETIPEFRVTHLIVINGFDHDQYLAEPSWFSALRTIYGPVAEQEGLRASPDREARSLHHLSATADDARGADVASRVDRALLCAGESAAGAAQAPLWSGGGAPRKLGCGVLQGAGYACRRTRSTHPSPHIRLARIIHEQRDDVARAPNRRLNSNPRGLDRESHPSRARIPGDSTVSLTDLTLESPGTRP